MSMQSGHLMEQLVGITVTAVIIATVGPSLMREAKIVKCKENIRQITTASYLYMVKTGRCPNVIEDLLTSKCISQIGEGKDLKSLVCPVTGETYGIENSVVFCSGGNHNTP